jgi:predicted CXXCH cytochrome family protein
LPRPHGAINERLVKRDSINDLCLSCHQEKRGRSSGSTRRCARTATCTRRTPRTRISCWSPRQPAAPVLPPPGTPSDHRRHRPGDLETPIAPASTAIRRSTARTTRPRLSSSGERERPII